MFYVTVNLSSRFSYLASSLEKAIFVDESVIDESSLMKIISKLLDSEIWQSVSSIIQVVKSRGTVADDLNHAIGMLITLITFVSIASVPIIFC